MKLSRLQKLSLAFFVITWGPSYLIADWRHNANLSRITHEIEQEQALRQSAEKLISNCEQSEAKNAPGYGPHHQICANGIDTRERTAQAIETLTQEKEDLPWRKFRNLLWAVVSFNLIGFILYKGQQLIRLERLD